MTTDLNYCGNHLDLACSASPQGMTTFLAELGCIAKTAVNKTKPLMHVPVHEHIFGCSGLLYKSAGS